MRRHRAYCAALAASTGFRGICTVHAMPQVPSGMQLTSAPRALRPIPPASSAPQYAYILATRTRGMHIQLLLAVGEFLICVAQCALPCLIIKNIVDNAGLPTAYGIDQTHQNRVCSFARSNCRLLVCVPRFRATRGTKLLAHTPDGIPPWNAVRRQGAAFRSRLRSYAIGLAMARDSPHAGRQRRIGIHAGRWQAPARIWHRDRLLRCRIRDFLLRGALHVRHIPARTSWRIRHRPGNQRRESLT